MQARVEQMRYLKAVPRRAEGTRRPDASDEGRTTRASAWLCRSCAHRIAELGDVMSPCDGVTRFVFANPAGRVFEIFTLRRAAGARVWGEPTLEHTWFVGHAWRMLACGGCGRHLGWEFRPVAGGGAGFCGLISAELVEGSSEE